MKIQGTHTFDAPRDTVWPMLLDPDVLAHVMPGAEKLEQVGDNEYEGTLMIRVGPVQGKFDGHIVLTDIRAPEGYHMEVNGKGAPGFVKGTGNLRLEGNGDQTILHYEGDAQVGGRLASVGQRLLDTSAKAIIRQSLEGLEQQVQARTQAPPVESETAAAPPMAEAPTQLQFATGVARNMLEELVPPDRRDEVLAKGLLVLGGIILVRLISEWWMNRLAQKIADRIQQ